MHVSEKVVDENGRINPHKIDLMGRMGRAYYVRASGEAVHTIFQPVTKISIGYNQLPDSIRNSTILTANNIGQLAGLHHVPEEDDILALKSEAQIQEILGKANALELLHRLAQRELLKENIELAGKIAWLGAYL